MLVLLSLLSSVARAQQPPTPSVVESVQRSATGAIRGTVTTDGLPLTDAQVRLATPEGVPVRELSTSQDGTFVFPDVPPGTYTLEVSLRGFTPAANSVTVAAGESTATPIALTKSAVNISVDVIATQEDIATAQLQLEEQQRFLFIFPNFYVSYNWNAAPLTRRQKFSLAFKNSADPGNLLLVGTVAGIQQATNSFNGYGQGAAGYGRRYGADLGNLVAGTFVSEAVLPSLLHQDPRYFLKGNGTVGARLRYALKSVVICRGDNGHLQPAYSRLIGDMSAGAISNLYYAPSDRKGASLTLTNGLLAIAGDVMNNVVQEFFLQKITRHAKIQSSAEPSH